MQTTKTTTQDPKPYLVQQRNGFDGKWLLTTEPADLKDYDVTPYVYWSGTLDIVTLVYWGGH